MIAYPFRLVYPCLQGLAATILALLVMAKSGWSQELTTFIPFPPPSVRPVSGATEPVVSNPLPEVSLAGPSYAVTPQPLGETRS